MNWRQCWDTESETFNETMNCLSCRKDYQSRDDAGTSKKGYVKAKENKKELKRKIETEKELNRKMEDLKTKVDFLKFWSPLDHLHNGSNNATGSTDVVLIVAATGLDSPDGYTVPLPAHKDVLTSQSPVFKAMLENETEEIRSGTIKISVDVSFDALCAFVNYMYTAEACLDEPITYDLFVLAEKYQVKHLKAHCEKFLISKLNRDNSIFNYTFAHQHNAKDLIDASLAVIINNMKKLAERKDYRELVEKNPRLVVEIYEAYMSKQFFLPIWAVCIIPLGFLGAWWALEAKC